ncbi:hypothetical protein [Granulicella sibirica]|uniref:Flagellar FliJ protein n=1 Tax=Granulicella sibirica TaxID=2479048 RepID=A0A4Q0T6Q6_9BACT|nr:hypothetical protein [Granulicella sibirica]RXH57271.1 hypothetical protein GRAN_0581 [Granulicella sibirica]
MAFRFTLATVLRLREIAEEREERALSQILKEIAQAHQNLADIQARRVRIIALREVQLRARMSAAEIHISQGEIKALDLREKDAQAHIRKLDGLRQQQVKVYETEHRKRELLAGLREQQLYAYRREQTRQEQNMMDDNFSARRALR